MMNTHSKFVGPSIIVLQPHVGRFHASDREKSRFSAPILRHIGIQVGVQQHAGATIVDGWHCLDVWRCQYHPEHISSTFQHTFTAPCWQASWLRLEKNLSFQPTSGQVWPSSGGITACRCNNSACLALIRCITRSVTLPE